VKLNRIKLENFRNHGTLELDFKGPDGITYLVGPNASGKTNILEAIYVLALIKSFRGKGGEDLIGWGGEFCRVTAETEVLGHDGNTTEKMNLEAFYGLPPNPRQSMKINGVKKSAADFIGNFRLVLFHPEDLNMLYLGPDLRRRYLDMINIQLNRKYYRALSSCKKILKQRNALLKAINEGHASAGELDVWDGQLAQSGAVLMAERISTVKFLNERIGSFYGGISGRDDKAGVEYRPSASITGIVPDGAGDEAADEAALEKSFLESLRAARANDLRAEVTTVGPHRDELEFTLNGRTLASHASRGEYRSILLAMKLLEIEYLKERGGETPVLLLDDVFSELDPDRQRQLTEAIKGVQTIITASHPDDNIIARTHRSLVQVKPSLGILKK
jgi:DNA replication and repair protein RecF